MISFLLLPLIAAQPSFNFGTDIDGQVTGYTSGRYGSPARFMEYFLKWAKYQTVAESNCNLGTNSHKKTSCLVYIANVCDFAPYGGERASLTTTCRSKVDAYFPPSMSLALRNNLDWNHLQLRRELVHHLPKPPTVASVFAMGMLIIRGQSRDADHVADLNAYVDNRNAYPAFRDWVETAPLRALSVSNLPTSYTRAVLNEARTYRSYMGKRAILASSANDIYSQIRDSNGHCRPQVLNEVNADVMVSCHQLLDGYCNTIGKTSGACRDQIAFVFGRSVYKGVEDSCSPWKSKSNCNDQVNAIGNAEQKAFAGYLRDEYLKFFQ